MRTARRTIVIGLLLAFIAYVCIATVITLALVIGYWWHTEQLTDEKLFRIMALLHDVDLNQIAEAHRKSGDEVPPEEPSLVDISHQQQILDRNHEVKLLALQRGSQEYHHRFQLLKEQADRNDRLAQDLQNRLKQHEELTTQENVAKVVSQLEQLQPDIAKQSLMRWIDQGRMEIAADDQRGGVGASQQMAELATGEPIAAEAGVLDAKEVLDVADLGG